LGNELNVVISPILDIKYRDVPVDLAGIAGVIVTSGNGVRALAARADVAGLTAYCVGDRTAETATACGMVAVSAGGAVADLVRLIRDARPKGALLHVRGAKVRGDPVADLQDIGVKVRPLVLYDQIALDLSPRAKAVLAGEKPVVLPLFSPRSAEILGRSAQGATAPLILVSLSDAVAQAWGGPVPKQAAIAVRPDANAMLDAIAAIYTGKLA
jgi:uroporphyrinogen-III synthase